MRNKVIMLILFIPLVLMVCVFSAATVASNQVDIAVTGLTLFHNREEIVNIAEGETFQIKAKVSPINATNDGLIYTYEAVGNSPIPNIQISESGLITVTGYGTAKIIVTTKDGAYKKSFVLEVISTVATDLEVSLSKTANIVVGDTFSIIGKAIPDQALDKNIVYYSSNNDIVKINQLTGECKAVSSGNVTLKALLNNGLNGKIEKEINVTVYPSESNNPITFNGTNNLTDNVFTDEYSLIMEVNFSDLHKLGEVLSVEDILLSYDNSLASSVEVEEIDKNNGIYKYRLNVKGLTEEEFTLKASINHEYYSEYQSELKLNKIIDLNDIQILCSNFKQYIKVNSINSFQISVNPQISQCFHH